MHAMLPGGLVPIEISKPPPGWRDPPTLRRGLLRLYRVIGPVGLALVLLGALEEAGLIGPVNSETLPPWTDTLLALSVFGLVLAVPLIFIIAVVFALKLGRDWRIALPMWLLLAAFGVLLCGALRWIAEDRAIYLTGMAVLAFLLSATWAGYATRVEQRFEEGSDPQRGSDPGDGR